MDKLPYVHTIDYYTTKCSMPVLNNMDKSYNTEWKKRKSKGYILNESMYKQAKLKFTIRYNDYPWLGAV